MRFTSCTNTFTLSNGTAIPCIGYGTFETPADEARTAVREALETGYRHIDTAAVYGNQEAVGAGIRDSGIPRDQLFVTSKLWNTERGYENTLKACEQTLNELGVDYLDPLAGESQAVRGSGTGAQCGDLEGFRRAV